MAKSCTIKSNDYPSDSDVPKGGVLVDEVKKNGTHVKCYTNVLRQKFYSKSDLKRYINYAKKRELSIYAPDFHLIPPVFRSNRKIDVASPSQKKDKKHTLRNNGRHGGFNSKSKGRTKSKKQNEFKNNSEIQCSSANLDHSIENRNERGGATTLVQISTQSFHKHATTCNIDNRSSRRLVGLKPELQNDFTFTRALEYIIKDKHRL